MIVLNEKEWAESVIASRQLGKDPVKTLFILARYYRQALGFKKVAVRKKLSEFLLQCDPSCVLVHWADILDKLAKGSGKHPLTQIDSISITEAELVVVKAAGSPQRSRLLFALLCVAKFWNAKHPQNNGWVNIEDREIMTLANINTSVVRQCRLLRELRDSGCIRFSRRVNNLNIKVECIQYDSPTAIQISDFRSLGSQYQAFLGEAFIQCQQCGLTTKKTSNSRKYCTECASDMYIQKSVASVMRCRAAG